MGFAGDSPEEATLVVRTLLFKNLESLVGFFLSRADIRRQKKKKKKRMLVTTRRKSKPREVVLDPGFELLISDPGESIWQCQSDLDPQSLSLRSVKMVGKRVPRPENK